MKRKILTVEDTFLIQDRGLVILGRKTDEFVNFKIGDLIEIKNADKTGVLTKVKGLEFIIRRYLDENSTEFKDSLNLIGFTVEIRFEKSQISKGASIWLLNRDS